MIGLRGASQYINRVFKYSFILECKALVHIRNNMNLDKIYVMVSFFRTVEKGRVEINVLSDNGLKHGENSLNIWRMCKQLSNVFAIDELEEVFDGFSIEPNDLTQLVIGCDRESSDLAPLFDEINSAIKAVIKADIKGAHRHGLPLGLCGQAPSDNPDFADFLVDQGIDSISITRDSVLQVLDIVHDA